MRHQSHVSIMINNLVTTVLDIWALTCVQLDLIVIPIHLSFPILITYSVGCFKLSEYVLDFQTSQINLIIGETIYRVLNSWDPDKTLNYSASHPDLS